MIELFEENNDEDNDDDLGSCYDPEDSWVSQEVLGTNSVLL